MTETLKDFIERLKGEVAERNRVLDILEPYIGVLHADDQVLHANGHNGNGNGQVKARRGLLLPRARKWLAKHPSATRAGLASAIGTTPAYAYQILRRISAEAATE